MTTLSPGNYGEINERDVKKKTLLSFFTQRCYTSNFDVCKQITWEVKIPYLTDINNVVYTCLAQKIIRYKRCSSLCSRRRKILKTVSIMLNILAIVESDSNQTMFSRA